MGKWVKLSWTEWNEKRLKKWKKDNPEPTEEELEKAREENAEAKKGLYEAPWRKEVVNPLTWGVTPADLIKNNKTGEMYGIRNEKFIKDYSDYL